MTLVFNREKAIDALVSNDLDYVENTGSGREWLESILLRGFVGYEHQSDDRLYQECLERDIPESFYFDEV